VEQVLTMNSEDSSWLCAQKLAGGHILLGGEGGLSVKVALGKLVSIVKGLRVVKIDLNEEFGSLVVLCGKSSLAVRVYDLKDMTAIINMVARDPEGSAKDARNLVEKYTKLEGSKGCLDFKIVKPGDTPYVVMALKRSVMISHWAPAPFNKFMEVKEIPLPVAFAPGYLLEVVMAADRIQKCVVSSKDDTFILDFETERCDQLLFAGEKRATRSFVQTKDNQFFASLDGFGVFTSLAGECNPSSKIPFEGTTILLGQCFPLSNRSFLPLLDSSNLPISLFLSL